jgi:hypothetical protein
MSTTNQEKPFEPAEHIEFCDERYVVIANYGTTGTVREFGEDPLQISPFYWTFEGAECRRVNTASN